MLNKLVTAKLAGTVIAIAATAGVAAAASGTMSPQRPSLPQQEVGQEETTSSSGETTTTAAGSTSSSEETTTTAAGSTTTAAGSTTTVAGGSSTTEATDEANGWSDYGHCVAWHGGRETGNKLNAPPFMALADKAGGADKIAAFCDTVFAAKDAARGAEGDDDEVTTTTVAGSSTTAATTSGASPKSAKNKSKHGHSHRGPGRSISF